MPITIKCQRAVGSEPMYLFYDQSQELIAQFLPFEVADTPWPELFGSTSSSADSKFFASATWPDVNTPPTFIEKLPDQGW
jgi:hypothetical protein